MPIKLDGNVTKIPFLNVNVLIFCWTKNVNIFYWMKISSIYFGPKCQYVSWTKMSISYHYWMKMLIIFYWN